MLFEMNKQRRTVSGDYVQGSFQLLPHSGDRVRGCLYFAQQLAAASSRQQLAIARWNLRAALTEFRSIFDLLPYDFRRLSLERTWRQSSHKLAMDADPVVAILRKVRDFAVHSVVLRGEPKTFKVLSSRGGANSDLYGLVIEPLDRAKLSRGSRDELSDFDDAALETFNEQASTWPADLLLQLAVFSASEYVASFLRSRQADLI
jgi:hypothetical protein